MIAPTFSPSRRILSLMRLAALLACLIMPRLVRGADFEAPIATSLDLLTAVNAQGQLTLVWTGRPEITPRVADLTLTLEAVGAARKKLLTQPLTMTAGKTTLKSFSFAAPAAGSYRVIALVKIGMSGGQYAKTDLVRFVMAGGKASVVAEPALTARQFEDKYRPALPRTRAAKAVLGAPDLAGFWVRGNVRFTNVRFTTLHTTQTMQTWLTTETQPIRRGKVQVCDLISSASFFFYQVLGTVYPDDNGNFEYYVDSNDDGDGTGRDIFLHFVADSTDCRVQDYSGTIHSQDFFPVVLVQGMERPTLDWSGGEMDLSPVILKKEQSGPWNIMDAVRQGADLVRRCGAAAPKAVMRWTEGNPNGAYFDPATQQITLRGRVDNSDEFDDGVILHEYGHLVGCRNSYDKNPGGMHYIDMPSTRTLAWGEGWADYFSCAARNTPYMIDSVWDAQAAGLSVDLETFSDIFTFNNRRGDDQESCVAGALWDIFDANNEYMDRLYTGPSLIWYVTTHYFNASRQCNFNDFYDGWRAYSLPYLTQVQNIMIPFGINYWGGLMVNSMLINDGGTLATSRQVTLNNATGGTPTQYLASEDSTFAGASWQPWSAAPKFQLSSGNGHKMVFFKVRDAAGQVSTAKFDEIELNEMRPLAVSGPALASAIPAGSAFDWYKIRIDKSRRYLIRTTMKDSNGLALDLYRANDLTRPVFYSSAGSTTSSCTDVNQILAAGDYVAVVIWAPITAAGAIPVLPPDGGTYSIAVSPYSYVVN